MPKKYRRPDPKPVDLVQASAKPVLTLDEAAALLSVTSWTVRQYIARGHLRPISMPATKGSSRVARIVRIARSELDAFIARGAVSA